MTQIPTNWPLNLVKRILINLKILVIPATTLLKNSIRVHYA
ncbi:MAG: hypothetical protein ACXAC7_08405 [Candidatus Hodarchaeales archaeon]|jgi:hypothetical protein